MSERLFRMADRFPADIGNNNTPFVQFQVVKYRDRDFVLSSSSSTEQSREYYETIKTEINTPEKKMIIEDNLFLPLPGTIANNYSLSWEMADLRAEELIVDQLLNPDIKKAVTDTAAIMLDKSAKVFSKRTPNPKKQALFNGIDPRTFTFDYTFTPQSKKEAETVEAIIKKFTYYSLPSLEDVLSSFYQFPHEFRISYHNVQGFPKIKTCACTGVATNYSTASVALLESGHAVQVSFSLAFIETELLRKQEMGL